MRGKYKLDADGKTPILCHDLMEWATSFEDESSRVVKQEDVAEGVKVSTVFLGLDHQWQPTGPPLLWETMIFGGPHDEYQTHYSSYDDAVAGHAKAVAIAKGEASE
jgi:hypothetical protein